MLIEGYEIYLESISLLLIAFVFLFLVLLSLLEWSGSKPMAQDRIGQEVPEAEGEFAANQQDPDGVQGSNYNNKAPSDTQRLLDKYINKVDFNMKAEDLDKPWFHKEVTRAMAQEMLKGKEQGSYLVRPSSQRGSYAMSWVKNAQSGEISHSLIHGLFPGFSLKQFPALEERYAISLSHYFRFIKTKFYAVGFGHCNR
jgi:SH2 domain